MTIDNIPAATNDEFEWNMVATLDGLGRYVVYSFFLYVVLNISSTQLLLIAKWIYTLSSVCTFLVG